MSQTIASAAPAGTGPSRRVRRRELTSYPSEGRRYAYLAMVVAIAVVLYYVYWEEGATLPLMLPFFHMSFRFFLMLVVVSNGLGAFAAVAGGLADRIGRVNLCLVGTFVIGVVQLVIIPNVHAKMAFSLAYCVIGVVEGIILVVTPALIRDFSPQVGRATAMGFWTVGPTLGYVVASLVATHTLTHLKPWQDQFIISGAVTLAVFAVAFVCLRELSPGLRDQLMVTERDRALVEARARGIDTRSVTAHPWRTLLKWDLLASSLGISTFLLIFYAAVAVFTLYWVVVFDQTTANANGINLWFGAANAGAVVVIGFVSDALHVRKPFMLAGVIGTIIVTFVLLSHTSHPSTGYYTNALIVMALGITIGVAYPAWMAAYTEAVEERNPALAATGLAIWGWVLRVVVAASFLAMPYVITTSNTIVDNVTAATALQAFEAAQPYVPSLSGAAPKVAPASVISGLEQNAGVPGQALADMLSGIRHGKSPLAAIRAVPAALKPQVAALLLFSPLASDIQQGKPVSAAQIAGIAHTSPQLATDLRAEQKVVPAQHRAPNEWKRWWWVCLGGQVVFLVMIGIMRGRWSPAAARRDIAQRERLVEAELARLQQEQRQRELLAS
ncbi:MAG TPA: MFS transporter [Acidimicrobiales bacterium]|nr:MFS transporter [Acidimicrobiales bacterium]